MDGKETFSAEKKSFNFSKKRISQTNFNLIKRRSLNHLLKEREREREREETKTTFKNKICVLGISNNMFFQNIVEINVVRHFIQQLLPDEVCLWKKQP